MPRFATRVGAVLMVVTLSVPTIASPASAHASLVAADPAQDSTVTAVVKTLTLTFSEPVPAAGTMVDAVGPDGVSVAVGSVRVEGAKAARDVGVLPVGLIRVTWRTTSLDGDPVSGTYGFTNAYVAPSPTPNPTPLSVAPTTPAASPSPAAADEGGGSFPTGWVIAALAALAAAIVGAVVLRRRRSA